MSTLKKIASAYNRLKRAYISGDIAYPRVANDYLQDIDLKWYEYPHKPLTPFDEYSQPLHKSEYPLTKETLPLFLTNKMISTPATLVKNIEFVDFFVDDNMRIRNRFADIMEDLSVVIDNIRLEAVELAQRERATGFKVPQDDEVENMPVADILSYMDKDGEISAQTAYEVMPYHISLAPEMEMTAEEAKGIEEERESEEKTHLLRASATPNAFKNNLSPSTNYTDEVTEDAVFVTEISALLQIEQVRRYIQNQQELHKKIEDFEKKYLSESPNSNDKENSVDSVSVSPL